MKIQQSNKNKYFFFLSENPILRHNIDEPCRYYAKINKPVTRGQLLHDSTYMWYPN